MAELLDISPARALDVNGDPVAGAKARFYVQGTTTPLTAYTTSALSIAHPTPLEADANGFFAPVWTATGAVKVVVTTPAEAPLYTLDPVFRTPGSASAASDITFEPIDGLSVDNVQDAIEGAYTGVLETVGQRVIAQGSLTGAEIIVEIPADIESIELTYWNYLPSSSGQNLLLQVGTGTVGSPTWVTSYTRLATQNTGGTVNGVSDTPSSIFLSIAQITGQAESSGSFRLDGFNAASRIFAFGGKAGVITGPANLYANENYRTASATHTLIRVSVASGTMAGNYRIIGYRKP